MLTREWVPGLGWVEVDAAFRRYGSAAESSADYWRLMQTPRYQSVLGAPNADLAAEAVAQAGYATDPAYAAKVRAIRPTTPEQRKWFEDKQAELRQAGAPDHVAELGAKQAALETGWGRSAPNHNYFGIKAPQQLAQAGTPDVMPVRAIEPQQPQAPMPAPRLPTMMDFDNDPIHRLGSNPWLTLGASILAANSSKNTGQVLGRGMLTAMGLMDRQRDNEERATYRRMLAQQALQKQMEEQQQQAQMQQLIGQLPPEQRAAAMADPSLARELLKNSMGMTRRYEMTERGPFDTYTGQVMGAQGAPATMLQHPNYKAMASEFDFARYQPESVRAAVEAGDPGMLKERLGFSDVMGQREKFEKRLSPLRAASQAAAQINELVSQKGEKGRPFSDVALVYSLVKSLDPESVVREGEVSLLTSAMPLYDRLQTYVKNISEGGLVGDVTRRDIVQTMDRLTRLYARNAEKLNQEITGIAKQYGVDPQMWTGGPIEFPSFAVPATPPDGVTIRRIGD